MTINSLSGGKSSAYMHMNYPADKDIFALVCVDDHNINRGYWRKNPDLLKYANDKLGTYVDIYGEFIGTPEHPTIVKCMYQLEQLSGREITWVRGVSFDKLIQTIKKAIPNQRMRFCTTEMKIYPIFYHCLLYWDTPCLMNIGFRYDEMERTERFTTHIKYRRSLDLRSMKYNWETNPFWREGRFPLIDNKVEHSQVQDYWADKHIVWPKDSNCQMCFWKPLQQLRKNFDDPDHAIPMWGAIMEEMIGHTFKKSNSLLEIADLGIQLDFHFGTGSGCSSGACID